MKKDIHPSYGEATVRCACGETLRPAPPAAS